MGAALALIVGAAFCLRVLRGSNVNLPGRPASFWLWAMDPDVTRERLLTAYLENLSKKMQDNDEVNFAQASALKWAKRCGAAAPAAAIVFGLIGLAASQS